MENHSDDSDGDQKHSKDRNNDHQGEGVESGQLLHSKRRCGAGDVGRWRDVVAAVVGLDGEIVRGDT